MNIGILRDYNCYDNQIWEQYFLLLPADKIHFRVRPRSILLSVIKKKKQILSVN